MRSWCAITLLILGACASDSSSEGGGVDSGTQTGQCAFCAPGDDCCDGFCINTRESAMNCGGCGVQCTMPTANTCRSGFCVCNSGSPCDDGELCCPSGCANTQTDPRNCGGCGIQCGANETCSGGMCVCAADGAQCGGNETCCAAGCVDTSSSVEHCGECDAACDPGSASICVGGQCDCSVECPAGTKVEGCCGDTCSDLCTDSNNCGECGKVCPDGGACDNGLCDGEIGFPNFDCVFDIPLPI